MKLFQDTVKDLSQRRRLTKEAYRVREYLMAVSDYSNRVPGTAKVAAELGMRQPHVSRAYAQLMDAGYLLKKDRDYFLNPLFCWKGSQKQLEQASYELFNCKELLGR